MTAANLVFAGPDGEPFTTSTVIAAETGNEHASVIRLVRENLNDLNEVGLVRFEIRPRPEGQHGGGDVRYAELDEPAAALLMTYLRNTPVVRDFKKRLVGEFYAMRAALSRRTSLAVDITNIDHIAQLAQATTTAVELYRVEHEQRLALQARAEADRPLVERAKTHAAGSGSVNRTDFGREVVEWAEEQGIRVLHRQIREFLARKLHLFVAGDRSDNGHATTDAIRRGFCENRRDTRNGRNVVTGLLTPVGQKYAWERITRYINANGTLELPREIGGRSA
ncbi:Rha family transcriptional regulator [Mycobacteroides abscessus]|uniref:Rha family transcriptional regulator n=1 Tax=Mycobacteroides abscessus TaxID=36809 RepID=UPI0018967B6E